MVDSKWKSIRLELACTAQFPNGSVGRAYVIRLPLDDKGLIDVAAFLDQPARATFRRFWASEPDEAGRIVRANGHWAMRRDGRPERRLIALPDRPIRHGRQFSLVDLDGTSVPLRVASVR